MAIERLNNKIQEIEESKKSYLTSIGYIQGTPYSLNTAKKIAGFNNIIKTEKTKIKRNKKKNKINRFYQKFRKIVKTYFKFWYGVNKNDIDEYKIRIMCRNELNIRQKNICAVCGRNMNDDITYEHIIPVCKNGKTSILNGKAVHSWCNNYLGILSTERKTGMFIDIEEMDNDIDCYKKYEDKYDDTYDDY